MTAATPVSVYVLLDEQPHTSLSTAVARLAAIAASRVSCGLLSHST
jgi:hypothetical protein